MRSVGITVWVTALLVAGCADKEPPTWPQDAKLETPEIGDTWVRLSWPAAQDDEGVVGYLLTPGREDAQEVPPDKTEFRASFLKDASAYRFSVVARDQASNVSSPLVVTVTTRDGTPPSWGEQTNVQTKVLKAKKETTLVRLSWIPATDNVAVTGYRILRDEETLQELGPETKSHELTVDDLSVSYLLEARDQAGNWSAGLPFDREQIRNELRRKILERKVSGRGINAILGTKGLDDGHIAGDIFTEGNHDDRSGAFDGIGGLDIASASDHRGSGGGGIGAKREEKKMKKAVVRLASVSTSGKELPADPIRAFLRKRKPALVKCYRQGLKKDAKLAGNRNFRLNLADGQVAKTEPVGGKAEDAAMDRCLIRQLGELKIPGASGQATIMLSFSHE